jgi:hypothetical protein
MKWEVGTPRDFERIFGPCLHTVFRGTHVVMTWDKIKNEYVVQESATRKVIARHRRKGECYKQMKSKPR